MNLKMEMMNFNTIREILPKAIWVIKKESIDRKRFHDLY
jgi:hypothetical protein